MNRLRACWVVVLSLLVVACTFPPLGTPTPSATASPSSEPTPTASPSSTPTPTPEPTPDLGAIPAFASGELATTTISGMRVRRLPGTTHLVITDLLPFQAELQVVMGPVLADGFGWYLVRDADTAGPAFDEGWIAAGYQPDAFVEAAGRAAETNPFVGGLAGSGDGEQGPIAIADEHHIVRWLALAPDGGGCRFAVSLTADDGEPIPAIRATIGSSPVPGTLRQGYFADRTSIRGQVFVTVESDCAWALAFERIPPEPTPAP